MEIFLEALVALEFIAPSFGGRGGIDIVCIIIEGGFASHGICENVGGPDSPGGGGPGGFEVDCIIGGPGGFGIDCAIIGRCGGFDIVCIVIEGSPVCTDVVIEFQKPAAIGYW
ncbi:hypothetical protein SteCoe_37816 [Stentor coeruleus]|uniref:Uncharacterized protein n=1 Tax=Stentor coeruleus TaxID=5963 RepID=A0A1R2AMB3_9CILI|nr:hypothetical protein SteCoe_37816 [Stentor coeruleus]